MKDGRYQGSTELAHESTVCAGRQTACGESDHGLPTGRAERRVHRKHDHRRVVHHNCARLRIRGLRVCEIKSRMMVAKCMNSNLWTRTMSNLRNVGVSWSWGTSRAASWMWSVWGWPCPFRRPPRPSAVVAPPYHLATEYRKMSVHMPNSNREPTLLLANR